MYLEIFYKSIWKRPYVSFKDIIIRGGEVHIHFQLLVISFNYIYILHIQNLFPIQIENRLTFHPLIHEAAVVAVPDDKYGETVGVWVVRSSHNRGYKLNREEVKRWVVAEMNPQVRVWIMTPPTRNIFWLLFHRTHPHMSGSWVRMVCQKNYPKQQAGKYKSIYCGIGLERWRKKALVL